MTRREEGKERTLIVSLCVHCEEDKSLKRERERKKE
jgi:hypothetical protein